MSKPIVLLGLFAACVDVPEYARDEQPIVGATRPDDWVRARAVAPQYPCSATLIGSRYVLTALHCTIYNGEDAYVRFYTDLPTPTSSLAEVSFVRIPPGTSRVPLDQYDSDDNLADIAVLLLDRNPPTTSVPATLAWTYPGEGATGLVVGLGNHNGIGNDTDKLAQVDGIIESEDDDEGSWWTTEHLTNSGDSGGPFYVSRKIVGVTKGGGEFTSVPNHLSWILAQIHYNWSGAAVNANRFRHGWVFQTFHAATESICQYATEHSPAEAYNWSTNSGECRLLTDVVSMTSGPGAEGWRSAAE